MGDNFAENLKRARKAASLTQKEVAEKIGVSKATYSLYEAGKRRPVIAGIKKLADVLDVTADELLGLPQTDYVSFITAEDKLLVESYHSLNADGQRRLMQYAAELMDIMKYKKG